MSSNVTSDVDSANNVNSYADPTTQIDDHYIKYAELLVQAFLLTALWILIIIRLKVARKSDLEFPSRWRTAGCVGIIVTGSICAVHFLVTIPIVILNSYGLEAIAYKRIAGEGYPRDPASYTDAEIAQVISLDKHLDRLLYANHILLTLGIWISKVAFLATFHASSYCLDRHRKLELNAVTSLCTVGSAFAPLSLVVFIAITKFPEYIPDDVRFNGIGSEEIFITADNRLEAALSLFNVACDLLITYTACRIIKSLCMTTGNIWLLVTMGAITVTVSIARTVIVMIEFVPTSANVAIETDTLSIPTVLLSELETFLGAIISCLPGLRAWGRGRHQQPTVPQQESKEIMFSTISGPDQTLEFVTFKE